MGTEERDSLPSFSRCDPRQSDTACRVDLIMESTLQKLSSMVFVLNRYRQSCPGVLRLIKKDGAARDQLESLRQGASVERQSTLMCSVVDRKLMVFHNMTGSFLDMIQ